MTASSNAHRSLRRHLFAGVAVALLLTVGVGGWAATSRLSGAAIAQGQLVVDSNVKKVQHPTGGVVGELLVRDGARVRAGDIVVRLDDTQTRANLGIVLKSLDELSARRARNEAERDGAAEVAFPADLTARLADPQVATLVRGETRLFEIRQAARGGQKAQLRERIAQLNEEIKGVSMQREARGQELDWIGRELKGVRELWDKNLIPYARVTTLERDQSRIGGERGHLTAAIAQSRGKIGELELQILQIDQDMRAETGKELAEIRAKEAELVEKKVAAEDQLKRIDIRAPQDGVVHQLSVHTVGGVVTPGEPLMLVVPESEALVVEGKLPPQDIDQVRLGQPAFLRLSAFSQQTTPVLNGTVSRVSADVTQDPKTGVSYYTIRIAVPESEMARLGEVRLVAGMPAEIFVQTGERAVLSYLVKPLSDQVARAFRER
jgi:HlyD family secretion protein